MMGLTPFLFSCQKEQLPDGTVAEAAAKTTTASNHSSTGRENCEPFQFAILALNNGSLTSSNLDVDGTMGYSQNVNSNSNAHLTVHGSCLVHSNAAFMYTPAVNAPGLALGLQTGPGVDWKLDDANTNATTLSGAYRNLPPDFTYTSITANKTITSTCTATGNSNTIVNISSINLGYGEKLTLVGSPSSDDGFIINVSGNAVFSNSEIVLNNVRPERVLFNFPNNSIVQVTSGSKFQGTILAPTGIVVYYYPESFQGSIVSKTIYAYEAANSGSYGSSGGCGGGSTSTSTPVPTFVQKTYCNGFQPL